MANPHSTRLRLLLALGIVAMAPSATAAAVLDADHPKWCRVCHSDPRYGAERQRHSAHARQSCRDCHADYQFNPHAAVQAPDGPLVDVHARAGFAQPVALASCVSCHDDSTPTPALVPHAKPKPGKPALDAKTAHSNGMPYCLDCHGEPHGMAGFKDADARQLRLLTNQLCARCHKDADKMRPWRRDPAAVAEYDHSMHARKLQLGSSQAPGCIDCHPVHNKAIAKAEKAGSTCAQCHKGADKAFAVLGDHKPITRDGRPVAWWTAQFFAWLTFVTCMALALHVALDLCGVIARSWRKRKGEPDASPSVSLPALAAASGGAVDLDGQVRRFDGWQRAAHGLMALGFTTLVLTGWPLSTAGLGASRKLVALLGGLQAVGWLHRAAAVVLILACAVHLLHLAILWRRGELRASMAPRWRDVGDLVANLGWFVGLRKARPRFDRYSYFEKFDYWAVFWGCAIMIGSGAVRWFPDVVMRHAPPWLYEVAFLAHTDEALLAALAIFVWHFYNVHLRPAVFPMSPVFLTGKLSLREHREDHADEHDRWVRAALAAERAEAEAAVAAQEAEQPQATQPDAAQRTEGGAS